MKNWIFRQLQRLFAHFRWDLVKRDRLIVIGNAASELEAFAGRSGYLRSKTGAGYHAERKIWRRIDDLHRAFVQVLNP
jgi:butyrate kinase